MPSNQNINAFASDLANHLDELGPRLAPLRELAYAQLKPMIAYIELLYAEQPLILAKIADELRDTKRDMNRLDKFIKIYQALRDAQTCFFSKTHWVEQNQIELMRLTDALQLIEAHARVASRTAAAVRILNDYEDTNLSTNPACIKAIYAYAFKASSVKMSTLLGPAFFRYSSLQKQLDKKPNDAAFLDQSDKSSRHWQIAMNLK